MLIKGMKWQLHKMNNSSDLLYSMMTTLINTILNTGNLLGEYISGALTHTCTQNGNSVRSWVC